MNLYFPSSPPSPAMNFIVASFWIENNTDKVNTIEVCVMKVKNVPTALTAIVPIFLAYDVPRFTT